MMDAGMCIICRGIMAEELARWETQVHTDDEYKKEERRRMSLLLATRTSLDSCTNDMKTTPLSKSK